VVGDGFYQLTDTGFPGLLSYNTGLYDNRRQTFWSHFLFI